MLRKSLEDQQKIRIAGGYLAAVLAAAREKAVVGMRLIDLDASIEAHIRSLDSTPSFLNFQGFPNSACLSLNEQVVHGIPDERILQDGDVLGIDAGLWYQGICVDSAITVGVGTISKEASQLLQWTQEALAAGIAAARPGRHVGSISHAVQSVAEKHNLGIVRALTGHGVGHAIWEAPEVPNYGRIGDGMILRPGMVLAIEPMFTLGSGEVLTQIDGWGIVSADETLSAQFEHTVIITEDGADIVTR